VKDAPRKVMLMQLEKERDKEEDPARAKCTRRSEQLVKCTHAPLPPLLLSPRSTSFACIPAISLHTPLPTMMGGRERAALHSSIKCNITTRPTRTFMVKLKGWQGRAGRKKGGRGKAFPKRKGKRQQEKLRKEKTRKDDLLGGCPHNGAITSHLGIVFRVRKRRMN
jgi:hypothetical protein